jgi:hypothetical protein
MPINLTPLQKEKIKNDLIKAGAIQREKPLTPSDHYYSTSIGKTNQPILSVRI